MEKGIVKKVNQLRKLTRSSKESLPKLVKLFNPQKKGNKGKKVIIIKNFKKEKEETRNKILLKKKLELASTLSFKKI